MSNLISKRQLNFELKKLVKVASKNSKYEGELILSRRDLVNLINKITGDFLTVTGFNIFVEGFCKANKNISWVPKSNARYNVWGDERAILLMLNFFSTYQYHKKKFNMNFINYLNMEGQNRTLKGMEYKVRKMLKVDNK